MELASVRVHVARPLLGDDIINDDDHRSSDYCHVCKNALEYTQYQHTVASLFHRSCCWRSPFALAFAISRANRGCPSTQDFYKTLAAPQSATTKATTTNIYSSILLNIRLQTTPFLSHSTTTSQWRTTSSRLMALLRNTRIKSITTLVPTTHPMLLRQALVNSINKVHTRTTATMVVRKADTSRDRGSSSNNTMVRHNSRCITNRVHPQAATMMIEDEAVVREAESAPAY